MNPKDTVKDAIQIQHLSSNGLHNFCDLKQCVWCKERKRLLVNAYCYESTEIGASIYKVATVQSVLFEVALLTGIIIIISIMRVS